MKDKILELLDESTFVSGELLAKKLNISRTAVWKHIRSLEQYGYKFESVRNKGYRLMFRPDIPLAEEVIPHLHTKVIGREFHYFPSIPSTNAFAKELVSKKTLEGTVVVSDVQTSGRGRKSRTWDSPLGGLWFSIILYPHIPPQHGMLLTMASSVAVVKAINDVCNISPIIKWPNDLLLNGKKVCGILTELDAEMDSINYSVIGIGINVNNSINNDLVDIAASLRDETGSDISRVELLVSILQYFDELYQMILEGKFSHIRDLWYSLANIIGKTVQVQGEREEIIGEVIDVDESGCLIIQTDKGPTRIVSGDVTYL